jgi:putative peptidoglycan lipid II flippase
MVRRLVALFSKNVTGMHAAAYVIAFFSLVSQIFGLLRDRMLAHLFGASSSLDVYYAAFRIPDLIFASLASIVSLFVLIPFLSKYLGDGGREKARVFLSEITTFFICFVAVVSVVVAYFAPVLGTYLYPGFSSVELGLFVKLTRILLWSPILLGFSNILSSVTQLSGRFVIYALSPVFYNIGIIGGIIFLYPQYGLSGVGWGVVIGALLHVLIQVPSVVSEGLMPRAVFRIDWSALVRVVSVSLPRTATLALNQVVLIILVGLASTLGEGSVTVFTFASNLYLAPLTLIGVSYSVAAFPTLSRLFSVGDRERFLEQLLSAVRHVIFWSAPALTLLIVLRAHIVRTLLGSGAFDWGATRLTAAVLALFTISLLAHGLILLFVRGYYAAGKTLRPLLITVGTSLLTIVCAFSGIKLFASAPFVGYFLESLLRISDVGSTSVVVIAGAYSFGLIVNAAIFWFLFRRDFGGHIPPAVTRTFWQSAAAAILGGAAAYFALRLLEPYFDLSVAYQVFLEGLVAGVAGILLWVATLKLLGNTELSELFATLHGRFWKVAPIAPPPEEL